MTQPSLSASDPSDLARVRGDAKMISSLSCFPKTRYQGSKRKIIRELGLALSAVDFETCLDLYSGTGTVTLLLRQMGKKVSSNDYLLFNQCVARVMHSCDGSMAQNDWCGLLSRALNDTPGPNAQMLVQQLYAGIFFLDEENEQIDRFAQNAAHLPPFQRDVLTYAVGQALLKKRPYNLFHRANLSMRTRSVKRSFGNAVTWETSIYDHAISAINELKKFPFSARSDVGAVCGVNTSDIAALPNDFQLVYIDPPYPDKRGFAIDYSDFYGFLDGLCDYQLFGRAELSSPHRPTNKQASLWSSHRTAQLQLRAISQHFPNSTLAISARSDSKLSEAEVREALYERSLQRVELSTYKYALSDKDDVAEVLFLAAPIAPT